MHKSKLVRLLKILTPEEFKNYPKFINSPFFNSNKNLSKFYRFFDKYAPDFEHPKMTREYCYKKLFPGKTYSYAVISNLMSEFTNLTEEYLMNLQFQKEEFQKRNRLVATYGERNAYGFFEKETQKQLDILEKTPYRDAEYYQAVAQLNFDYYFHAQTKKHTQKDPNLSQLMDSLDKQFVFAKLRISSEFKNRERVLKNSYAIRFWEAIWEEGKSGWLKETSFKLYDLLFKLYGETATDSVFIELKELFIQQIKSLRRLDQALILTQLINYAIRQINTGNLVFYEECLDLYKLGLEADLLLENGRISEAVYGNIALLGCHAKDFEWTQQFIDNHAKHLEERKRADAKALSQGTLYFHQNDFDSAYNLFYHHSFSNAYQPKARLFLIQTMFEKFIEDDSLFELLIAQIEAFDAFLRRTKIINPTLQTAYLNGIGKIKQLTFHVLEKKNLEKLEHEIKVLAQIMGKVWLLKKLSQLSNA